MALGINPTTENTPVFNGDTHVTENLDIASLAVSIFESIAAIWTTAYRYTLEPFVYVVTALFDESLNGTLHEEQADLFDRIGLLFHMTGLFPEEREEVKQHALNLFSPDTTYSGRLALFDAVAELKADERSNILEHARARFEPTTSSSRKCDIIREVAALPAGQRAIVDPEVVAQAQTGEDVHAGNRDRRTRRALQLFYAHQGEVSPDQITQGYEAFMAYLTSEEFTQQQTERGLFALAGPRIGGGFGPLVSHDEFTVLGLPVDGRELIARLWVFASGLDGPEETNAKRGMVVALNDGYDDAGERLCNQGKTQRLLVLVLQGRLDGVRIDEVENAPPLTPGQALNIFFQVPDHQAATTLAELHQFADVFCEDNPNVERDPFLHELNTYANASGIA